VLHHRPVGHGDHGLGDVIGEGPETGTESSGHNQGFHGATPFLSKTMG